MLSRNLQARINFMRRIAAGADKMLPSGFPPLRFFPSIPGFWLKAGARAGKGGGDFAVDAAVGMKVPQGDA